MLDFFNNEYQCFVISSIILGIGVLIDSINVFYNKRLYSDDGGLFSYEIQSKQTNNNIIKKVYKKSFFLLDFTCFLVLMSLRLGLSIVLIFCISNHWIIYLLLFLLQLVFNLKNIYTLSGADQMQNIMLFGLMIYSFDINENINSMSFIFIFLQLIVSYFFTGYHKFRSEQWRKGNALILVLNSESFGNHFLSHRLQENRFVAILGCWFIFIFQLTFLFWLLLSPNSAFFALSVGVIFHLSIAALMNLNHFFWVFISSYPIVLYISVNKWNYLYYYFML